MTNAVNLASAAGTGFLRNRVINGGMDIWQRGTSFSGAVYGPDRWFTDQSANTINRSTDAPSGFSYSSLVAGSSGTYIAFSQRIESLNTKDLPGQNVTVSFWAKSASGTPSLGIDLRYPGAADNWSSSTILPSQSVQLSTTWSRYTVTFSSLASGFGNGLAVFFVGTVPNSFYLTGVQLEAGSTATPFERRQYGQELALCQRYYNKSYDLGTVAGTSTNNGEYRAVTMGGACWANFDFPVEMRATPTVTTYASFSGAAGYFSVDSIGNSAVIATRATSRRVSVVGSPGVSSQWHYCQYVASAEL